MLKDEDIARSLKEQIQPQDFTDPLFQRAVQRIFDALEKTGRLDMGKLIQDEDEELNGLISHYSVLEMDYHDPHKHCQDCVDMIKQQNHARRMKALITAIKNAEVHGNSTELARLIEEQNRLGRKPGRRIPGL
jgi:replicative DNA helicase